MPDNNDPNDPNDPWKRKDRDEQNPPDLDEIFAKLIKKLDRINKADRLKRQFTGKGKGGGSGEASLGGTIGIGLIAGILFIVWLLSGIFIVSPAERGTVLRFGRYQRTVGPGPHWIPRFIESVRVVNVQRISTFSYNADMLTRDENIVFVSLSVQFRIDDARKFLFNVTSPVASLQQATASTLRQIVGNNSLDEILTTGRTRVRNAVESQLTAILAPYQTGLLITDVNLQPARPPEEVTEAFDDAIKAREDEQRYINQAEAYAEKVVPIAKGQANRALREAAAFKEQIVLKAKAETARYLALLPEYQRAPLVTKQRMYLATMESVLNRSSKLLVDGGGSNSLLYLPIDKLLKGQRPSALDAQEAKAPIVVKEDNSRPSSTHHKNNNNRSAYAFINPRFEKRRNYSTLSRSSRNENQEER